MNDERRAKLPSVTADEAMARVSAKDAIALVEAAFRAYGEGQTVLSDPSALSLKHPDFDGGFKVKGGILANEALAGFRLIADGTDDGSDWHFVFDANSALVKGVVDEKKLHWRRTAVTGVVAAKWLAPAHARTFALLGSGNIADQIPEPLNQCFDVGELRVATRRSERAEEFARKHSSAMGMSVRACESVEDAVAEADVVVSVTSAREPILGIRGLKPGATVIGLGGDHEIAASVLEWADVFVVDDLEFACIAGSVAGWLRTGALDRAAVQARLTGTIGDVAVGRIARVSADQRILAIVQGMAICDLALANAAIAQG